MASNVLRERGPGGRQGPQTQPQHNQWTWERFCREEAREAASAFLERVRRFKGRHATARDVHDSTFTNEFSAAFLEESSILMASEGETILPTTSNTFTTSLPSDIHSRVRSRDTGKRRTCKQSSPSKSSWWNGLFKWSKSKRAPREERDSSASSSASTSGSNHRVQSSGSTKQKRKRGIRVVKETPQVQMLNLAESEDGVDWSLCRLMLVEQQDNYQIEIYCPPKNPMPKMSIFCFLIDEVRSTTSLEMPDSNSCFAIKSQNHGEYVFDVKEQELKEDWVRMLQAYTHKPGPTENGGSVGGRPLPARSSHPSSHLATLPRPPSQHSSPARRSHDARHGTAGGGAGGASAAPPSIVVPETSPLVISKTSEQGSRGVRNAAQQGAGPGGRASEGSTPPSRTSRHLSLSEPRRVSVLTASLGPSGSEESVLVDMNSFMRNYSVTRSPNRQRKTMSLFIEPSSASGPLSSIPASSGPSSSSGHAHTSIIPPHMPPNPYMPTSGATPTSPTHHRDDGVGGEAGLGFPYTSSSPPSRESPPPPLPRRGPRPHSMFLRNTSMAVSAPPTSCVTPGGGAGPVFPSTLLAGHRPLPVTPSEPMPNGTLATPTSPTAAASAVTVPTCMRPLPATPTDNPPIPARPPPQQPSPSSPPGVNGRGERTHPKRKMSHPVLELPLTPHTHNNSHQDLPSPRNLDTCSQSSSSSALHPVSLAALSHRKSSVSFTPTNDHAHFSARRGSGGNGGGGASNRVRKLSAPILTRPQHVLEGAGQQQHQDASDLTTPTSPAYVIFNGKERDFNLSPTPPATGATCGGQASTCGGQASTCGGQASTCGGQASTCAYIPEGSTEPEDEEVMVGGGSSEPLVNGELGGAGSVKSEESIQLSAKEGVTGSREALEGVTGSREALEGVTGSREALEGVTGSREALEGVTGSREALEGVTGSREALEGVAGSLEALETGDRDGTQSLEDGEMFGSDQSVVTVEAESEEELAAELEAEAEGEREDSDQQTASGGQETLSSPPVACDLRRGLHEGEEQTDHATLSFPVFSHHSSPPQLQGSLGSRVSADGPMADMASPTGDILGVSPGAITLGETPPPLPARNSPLVSQSTPPIPIRDGVTSQNSLGQHSASTHSISSLDDSANPIFVETSEGQGYVQTPPVHTRHPYEYWATNQQDVANMRLLSRYPWFHGMISRTNASQLVVAEGDAGTGQYLVRQSESREGDFVLTFNYHNRAKHLRMTVDSNGCNIQHLWFDSVPSMLDYFKTNSIPLESFWLNDDVKLTSYINRSASDAFRTTTVLNVEQLSRVPPRRSSSLHLGVSRSVTAGGGGGGGGGGGEGSSHPGTPSPLSVGQRGSSSASTNSLPHAQSSAVSGWRQIFRSQRSSSAGNVGRVQRSHSHNAGSVQATGRGGGGGGGVGGGVSGGSSQRNNAYVWRHY